jgi:hypothetical protein
MDEVRDQIGKERAGEEPSRIVIPNHCVSLLKFSIGCRLNQTLPGCNQIVHPPVIPVELKVRNRVILRH